MRAPFLMSLTAALATALPAAAGEPRAVRTLSDGWRSVCRPEGGGELVLESVSVPHNWGDYWGLRWQGHGSLHGTAVYLRSFDLKPRAGRRAFLVFEGVGMYLGVKVNGREICRHRPAGKVVTTLDVTAALSPDGRNALEVTCEHPSDITDLPWICGGCSQAHCEGPEPTGLCRAVRLVETDEVRIAPFGVFVWGREPFDAVQVEVEVANAGPAAATRQVRACCAALGVDVRQAVSLAPGETRTVKLASPMRGVRRWSAEEPNLYRFDVRLEQDGAVRDADAVETGFRTVSWPFLRETKDRRLFVNGRPVFVHGVCETDHRFGGSLCFEPEEIDARARLIKETLGFNAVRDGHEPHDLRWGRNWDRLGVYWWPQFGTHNYYENEAFARNYRTLFRQWMKERRNSPSVVLWGLQNESTLDLDLAREMTAFAHAYDPVSSKTDRLTTCCNFGVGADWTVVQNWSGTYGGDLERYGEEIASDQQLLVGEYGAWRVCGLRETLSGAFDPAGRWSEDRAAYILHRKIQQAWKTRDRQCGHFLWLLFSHENPGRRGGLDDGYRRIDKAGPVNNKGLLTLWGAPTAAYYVYRAYGDALRRGRLDEIIDEPLDRMIARGRELERPRADVPPVSLAAEPGRTYLYRLNCGGDAATDEAGQAWLADSTGFSESWSAAPEFAADRLSPVLCSQGVIAEGVANARGADGAILSSYRWGRGKLKFTFSVRPRQKCRVEAWFAEPGGYGRLFDVAVNGTVVERALDLPGLVGNRSALKRSWDVEADAAGRIVLTFPRVPVSQAVVSALAVSVDAADAACRAVVPAGYPADAGLTWRKIASETVERVPQDETPPYAPPSPEMVQPITPTCWRRASTFIVPVSNVYSIRFKLRRAAVACQDVWWELVAQDGKRLLAEGSLNVPRTDTARLIDVPLDTFINAGYNQVTVTCPEGVVIDPIGLVERKGMGQ